MEKLQRVQLPAVQAEDINSEFTIWRNGRLISIDEGDYVSLFIDHKDAVELLWSEQSEENNEVEPLEHNVVYAQHIRVPKPLTRAMAINAAEMSAYGLNNAMEVASFNASLSRKSRTNETDEEVAEHDAFISWVKNELTKIGI